MCRFGVLVNTLFVCSRKLGRTNLYFLFSRLRQSYRLHDEGHFHPLPRHRLTVRVHQHTRPLALLLLTVRNSVGLLMRINCNKLLIMSRNSMTWPYSKREHTRTRGSENNRGTRGEQSNKPGTQVNTRRTHQEHSGNITRLVADYARFVADRAVPNLCYGNLGRVC